MSAVPQTASSQSLSSSAARLPKTDFLPLKGTDHVEFYVGNARQAAYFYRAAFGMSLVAYAGPETGQRDRASYVLQQGKVRFVLTTPLRSQHPIAQHVHHARRRRPRHRPLGRRRAPGLARDHQPRRRQRRRAPRASPTNTAASSLASIAAYGDTIHTFVERSDYTGPFLPGYRAVDERSRSRAPSACSTSTTWWATWAGTQMNEWVDFYANVMGFSLYQHFDDNDISTEYSALMSKVMANGNGYVKFPINEPAEGKKQIADRRVSRLLSAAPACSTSRSPPTTFSPP